MSGPVKSVPSSGEALSPGTDRSSTEELAPSDSLPAKVTNFVIFQAVYAACVLGAVQGHLWLGPVAGAVLLPLNLWFFQRSQRGPEVRLWLAVGLLGFLLDSGLLRLNVMAFPDVTRIAPEAALSAWLVPPWIVTLWVSVGTMLRTTLAWLRGRPALAAALGFVGGPFSFWSGTRLGATELPLGWGSLALLGLEYAIVMPLLLRLAYPPCTERP